MGERKGEERKMERKRKRKGEEEDLKGIEKVKLEGRQKKKN